MRKLEPGDLGDFAQQKGDAVAAVVAEVLLGDADDVVAGVRRVVEVVALVPEAELEIEPAARGLAADELEGVEVLLALNLGHAVDPDAVVRQVDEEGIGEVEVDVAQDVVVVRVVVADAEVDREAVEAVGREHVEVLDPARFVVEPGLVLDLAAEGAGYGTDAGRRLFDERKRAEELA